MAIKFSTSNDASRANGVKMLVYGPAGMGKTSLIPTAPNPVAISIEQGLLSLNAENQRAMFGRAVNVPVIEINSYADFYDAYQFVATSEHAKGFETICLDSLSDIAEVVLTNQKTLNKDPRKAYGEMNDKVAELIRKFRDLPNKHVYMTAKQDREKDEASGITLFTPAMPGRTLTRDVPHFFDEVFALGISPKAADGSSYRFLRTRADIQFHAKDRSGALDEIEKPDLGYIISKIKSHVQ